MKRTFGVALMTFLLVLALSACGCKHEWQEATCLQPQICSLCEEIQGEALGHVWKDATCIEPRTCSRCGETEGEAMGHAYGEWGVGVEATALAEGKMVRSCDVCKKEDSKSYRLDTFIKDDQFIFTPEEFRKLFFDNFVSLEYSKFGGAQIKNKDGQVMVAIRDLAYNNVGNIGFVADKNSARMATVETQSGFDGIIMIISAPEEFVANAIIAVVMTCNPTITEYGAREVAKSVLSETTTYRGVSYTFAVTGDYYTMTAVANDK